MQITLDDIKKPLSFKISYGLSMFTIRDYAENVNEFTVDFDVFLPSIGKNLQRPLVWILEQKQALVISIFKGTYIPGISLIQHKDYTSGTEFKTYLIIDGKQRLTTMMAFYKNEFPIIVKGHFFYFKDLPEVLQSNYRNYYPHHNIAYSYEYPDPKDNDIITDQDKIDWFEMINFAGTPQDIEHLNSLKA